MEEQKIPSRSDRHKKKQTAEQQLLNIGNMEQQLTEKTDPILDDTTDHTEESAAKIHATIQELLAELEKRETEQLEAESKPKTTERKAEPVQQQMPEQAAVPVSRTAVHKKKKKKRRGISPAAGFLLLFVMLLSGAWCGYTATNLILPGAELGEGMDQEMLNNINLLLLGCDEREGDAAARADVIMVATIRPKEKQVSIFSIPRDTRVSIEGHNKDKINHAMAYGGIPLVQSSVENLLNIKIDHTVKVNFDGFINVIDALGGVNIEVPCRMYKPLEAIDLLPGYQTLSGAEALGFVRWRGDGTGDYGRIERQQQFLTAVTEKLKSMSIKQALDVASAVMDSIETDMSVRQMTSYGINLLGIGSESIKTYSFVGEALWINGVNYVEPDMAAIAEIVDKMQHGEPEPEAPTEAEQNADGTSTEPAA